MIIKNEAARGNMNLTTVFLKLFPFSICKVTMFVIQMKNALRGLSAPAAWQTPEKFFI